LAIEAGDTDLAFTAVESMSRDYQVDCKQAAAEVLPRLAKKVSPAASGGFARRCLELMRDVHGAQSDAVDTQKILALAAASAKKPGDLDLQTEVSRVIHRDKQRQRAAREIETLRASVEAEPNDADLNLQLGRLLRLKWCDWRTGVGFVEKVGDQPLASLASAEVTGVDKADTQEALADAWWSWAESQRSPWKKLGLARAAVHYAEVLNDREGLDRDRVENRLAEAMEAGGGTGEQAFLADIKESAVPVPPTGSRRTARSKASVLVSRRAVSEVGVRASVGRVNCQGRLPNAPEGSKAAWRGGDLLDGDHFAFPAARFGHHVSRRCGRRARLGVAYAVEARSGGRVRRRSSGIAGSRTADLEHGFGEHGMACVARPRDHQVASQRASG